MSFVQTDFKADRASLSRQFTIAQPATMLPELPIVQTPEVRRELSYLLGANSRFISESLLRRAQWHKQMQQIFLDEGVPASFLNLALVESGFKNEARSYAGAVGIWQFMRSTARLYGLKVSKTQDQREDPILSTIAAARHLKDLYRRFGDWYLALAAYNAGVGGIERAMIRASSNNFWTLARKRKIKLQTARYVPKIIATTIIVRRLEKATEQEYGMILSGLRQEFGL